MNTGEIIKKLRKEHNLTQEELGEKLGLKKSAIRKYEKNEVKNLKKTTIAKMCNIFGISPAYLLGIEDEKTYKTDLSTLTYEELKEYAELNEIPYTEIDYIEQPMYCSSPDIEMIEDADKEKILVSNNLLTNLSNKNNLIVAKTSGDSMDKIIPEGSTIIIEKVNPFQNISNNDIVLYKYENSLSVKEFIREDDRLIFRPNSNNPRHKDNIYKYETLQEEGAEQPIIIGIIKKVIFDL